MKLGDIVTVRFEIMSITQRRTLGERETVTSVEVIALDNDGNKDLTHFGLTFNLNQIKEYGNPPRQ